MILYPIMARNFRLVRTRSSSSRSRRQHPVHARPLTCFGVQYRLQRDGTKVQVQFIVTFRKRVENQLLHRMINRYVLVGWTDESNLEPKTIL